MPGIVISTVGQRAGSVSGSKKTNTYPNSMLGKQKPVQNNKMTEKTREELINTKNWSENKL